VKISKSELHGGKHPTECVPIHRGVSGEIHRKLPQPRAGTGVSPIERRDAHYALVSPLERIVEVFCEWRVWSERSGRCQYLALAVPQCIP
jgi:hypothetical protein